MTARYWKNDLGQWFWHKSEDEDVGPFASRKAAKNDFAEFLEWNATPQAIARLGAL